MPRILIVEDEPDIALGLKDDLTMEGYDVEVATDGIAALQRAREPGWDLVLLDVMLPGKDGFDVCRELRREGFQTPDHPADGAGPGGREGARLRAWRRRLRHQAVQSHENCGHESRRACAPRRGPRRPSISSATWRSTSTRAEVRRDGRVVDVTPIELKLLEVFVTRRGRVLSRDQMLDAAWGHGTHVTDRAVDAHIVNLRRKIEPRPRNRCLSSACAAWVTDSMDEISPNLHNIIVSRWHGAPTLWLEEAGMNRIGWIVVIVAALRSRCAAGGAGSRSRATACSAARDGGR